MHPLGQHIIGGFDGPEITPLVEKLITKYHLGGFVLFARNIQSPKQVRQLTRDLQRLSKTPLYLGVDQEGGRVFRLKTPFTQVPPMALVGRYFRETKDIKNVEAVGRVLGREVRAAGFNWDYAPVVDIHSNPNNPIIGDRSFGPDPKLVADCAKAMMKGLHAQGVLSCAKHFPGHGATTLDSHLDLPVLNDPGRLLWKRDIWPYRDLIKKRSLPTLMTAHVLYPELDGEHCATLSPKILTDLLRGRLGYKGLIVSDDLFMKAISDRYGIPQAALQFFRAGGDLTLICKEPETQIQTIELMERAANQDRGLKNQLMKAYARIRQLRSRPFLKTKQPPLSAIGCKEHKKIIDKILTLPEK